MKKPGKYLKFYYKNIEIGKLPGGTGLCKQFGSWDKHLLRCSPPNHIMNSYHHGHWGSGSYHHRLLGEFTPLRQNIVLLMACTNNEL